MINAGTFNVTADNDGIKSEPDEGDTASAGTVTINGGSFTINAQGDGIVAAEKLTINNGDFTIRTLDGYNSSSFNKTTMSCKGLKASSNNVADTENPTTSIEITGGSFNLNTADDAVHSDGYVTVTGGTFNIYTGDDGVHADVTLTLGTENGYERDPEITINSSYEGLEGAVVNIYSGKYYVTASDDGINAAGGSSNGSDPGQGSSDTFTPPQPGQGGPGQGGPGQGGFSPGGQQQSLGDSSYSINIYGGSIYVNCTGDGLDSNGALNLLGGDITVLSMQSGGDNSPLDADGTTTINGAALFAAGSRGMGVNLSSSSQNTYTSTSSYNANTVINVKCSGTTLRSEKLVRNVNYILYSSPNLGSCSVSTSSGTDNCKSNAFAHNWDNGTVENGVIKYTCQDCSAVERKSIAKTTKVTEYVEEEATTSATEATEATSTNETTATEATESSSETQATEPTQPSSETTAAESTNPSEATQATEPSESTQATEETSVQTTITLTASKTLYVGASAAAKATVTNAVGKTVFTSSNTSVATVSSTGKVTARKAGSVTITAKNNGKTASVRIKVVKRANTMTVKGRTITAKAKQKTTFTASQVLTVKNAKGTVVYKKLSGNSKISVDSKTGKLIVKKGLTKGKTYTVKVKVTAKGNTEYNAKSKTVTVKIRVK